jgi:hypothetical protein
LRSLTGTYKKEVKMNNDEQGPIENFLDGLDEQSGALSFEDLQAELQDRGIDLSALLSRTDAMIASYDKKQRLTWMKVADEKRESLRVAETPGERWISRKADEIRAAFALFLKSSTSETALAFRNRKELSLEDMAEILDANDRLKISDRSDDQAN